MRETSPSIRSSAQDEVVAAEIRQERADIGARSLALGIAVFLTAVVTERLAGGRFDRIDLAISAIVLAPQAIITVLPELRAFASSNISATAALVVGVNAANLAVLSARHSSGTDPVAYSFELVMLQLMFGYLFSGATNRHAATAGWTVTFGYLATLAGFTSLENHALVRTGFALVAVNLIGMAGRHQIEQADLRHIREKLRWAQAALTDPLTELPNRRGFMEAFETVVRTGAREGRTVAVAAIDLDGFKLVNDALGHTNGDAVLVQVADALRDATRRPLDIAGRLGGDEFAVVWLAASTEQAGELAETLRASIADRASLPGLPVTASIGVLSFEPERTRHNNLEWLQLADELARQAKRSGGDHSVTVDHGSLAVFSDDADLTRWRGGR